MAAALDYVGSGNCVWSGKEPKPSELGSDCERKRKLSELYTPMKYSFTDVGHASRVETLRTASSTHIWELSANGWTCQFDFSKPLTPRAKERRVQLGIIPVAKVSHEVDPYSRMAPRRLARSGCAW